MTAATVVQGLKLGKILWVEDRKAQVVSRSEISSENHLRRNILKMDPLRRKQTSFGRELTWEAKKGEDILP